MGGATFDLKLEEASRNEHAVYIADVAFYYGGIGDVLKDDE